jgi:hypothetical protein
MADAIHSLRQLRETAPEQLQGLSDRDLIAEYSKQKNIDPAGLLDAFGVPAQGLLSNMLDQAGAGLAVDVPSMLGKGIQYGSQDGGVMDNIGKGLTRSAQEREHYYEPDKRGMGGIKSAFIDGSRALSPSVALMATSAIPWVGPGLAVAGSVAMFGGSEAYDTYERVLEATGDADAARKASLTTGAIHSVAETAATLLGAKLATSISPALRGKPLMEKIVKTATNADIFKPFAGNMIKQYGLQVGTEVSQDVSSSRIENAYGAERENILDIAIQSGSVSAAMTTMFGPATLFGATKRSSRAKHLRNVLEGTDPSIPAEERAYAMSIITQEANQLGIPEADRARWVEEQLLPQELERTEKLSQMEQIRARIAMTQDPVERRALGEQFTALYNGDSGVARSTPVEGEAPNYTSGELMALEIAAYKEATRSEDAEAEKDLLAADPKQIPTAQDMIDDPTFDIPMPENELMARSENNQRVGLSAAMQNVAQVTPEGEVAQELPPAQPADREQMARSENNQRGRS